MLNINILYSGNETINSLLEQGQLQRDMPYFMKIVTASAGPMEALEIAGFIQKTFPNATVMGFSAAGIIYQGEPQSEGTLIVIQLLENTSVFQAHFSWDGKCAATIAAEIAEAIAGKSAGLVHVICGDHYCEAHEFVDEFNKQNHDTALIGGIAGDILAEDIPGFVFTPKGIVEKGIIIAAFCGSEFSYYNGVNTSHEPISGKQQVTKVADHEWLEINGQEIQQWLFEQFDLGKIDAYSEEGTFVANDMFVHFPMILEDYQKASRFLFYDAKNGKVSQYFSGVPEGTEFRIGYVNPGECLQESFRLCTEVMNQPIEALFCYSCFFRRLYLQNSAHWELTPYKNLGLCGAFMMGEFANINGRNEFLNGSCCLVGIAENESYVRPDIQAFDELKAIGKDTTALLNVVLKRQQEVTSRKNEQLLNTLLGQQQNQENQIYMDFNMGMPNYLKYKEDLKTNQFDKLCVMKTENAELLITHLGHTAYLKLMRNILEHGQKIIDDLRNREHTLMHLYVFNESTFFVAADERMSESHFMRICKWVHDNNHLLKFEGEEVVVTRFVVCLNQKAPIEQALNALAASQNTQNSFLICSGEDDGISTNEEFKMIGVLNRAFEQNGVIPFFQGIYSNKNKQISYYEALMRIRDVDGKLYVPGQFLNVAKKYHMYSSLSRIMMGKVFDLFSDREEAISINITVFDIQSEKTKNLIYNRLQSCRNPRNFVFEILEDEAYHDFEPLKEFIREVRALGARVAIDDFGSGYSNLYEVSNINFDIIKVDGNIIRNLLNNENNRKLLDVITHMGLLFDAEIVAEFVENQQLQEVVEQVHIGFSQGYLFAKPVCFEELNLK